VPYSIVPSLGWTETLLPGIGDAETTAHSPTGRIAGAELCASNRPVRSKRIGTPLSS